MWSQLGLFSLFAGTGCFRFCMYPAADRTESICATRFLGLEGAEVAGNVTHAAYPPAGSRSGCRFTANTHISTIAEELATDSVDKRIQTVSTS